MNREELRSLWKEEERVAHIHGWDFHTSADVMKRNRICRGITPESSDVI